MAQPNIFVLAADGNVSKLLPVLRTNPALAASQDAHGYSLVHAAASYGHVDLLRTLRNEFHVEVNLTDEDGESALFQVEEVEVARVLVEEMGIDPHTRNVEGATAAEKIESEGDYPLVATYLRGRDGAASAAVPTETSTPGPAARDGVTVPLTLPPNVSLNVGTLNALGDLGGEETVDPTFKKRIEDLAARDDFHDETGQQELRDLITDAVRGQAAEQDREVRRRTE
ncbi:MAG: hypothetical protein M1838_001489 [Thelocarpon superellum]|nr:MAG: hypothetical protein M1838_001489 [Thelocarpon superellum]